MNDSPRGDSEDSCEEEILDVLVVARDSEDGRLSTFSSS
jgi:hypothetical protein